MSDFVSISKDTIINISTITTVQVHQEYEEGDNYEVEVTFLGVPKSIQYSGDKAKLLIAYIRASTTKVILKPKCH